MADYIEREAVLAEYDRQHNGPPGGARKIIAEFPSADVVLRDCYNAILWENDVMRKQLAEIGKGFGQKMDDVAPVKHGKWIKPRRSFCSPGGDPVWECDQCGKGIHVYGIEHGTYGRDVSDGQWVSCPNCGAMMDKED